MGGETLYTISAMREKSNAYYNEFSSLICGTIRILYSYMNTCIFYIYVIVYIIYYIIEKLPSFIKQN
jgi:hypothetical protein